MWNLLQDELGGGVWPRLLVALVDTGAKGLILMAAAGLAAAALRRNAAAARHLVWMLALCGLLILPVVSLMMPKWTLPILPAIEAPAVAPIAATPPIATAPAAPVVVSTPMTEIAPVAPNVIPPAARSERPAAPIDATPPESAQAPMNYGVWLLATWLSFALLSLAPFAAGVVAVARMRRRAEAFSEGDLQALATALGRCIGLKRTARLLRSPAGSMPMATGFIKPAVFLPDDALAWSEEKRRVVLLHELAHVKRRDCLAHAIARTATSLHWFNPLAWLALRQLRIEREHACDDLVLAAGERPSAYAENLLEIARTLRASTVVSAAAITMAQKSQLEGRLLAVLDAARNRGLVTRKFAVICIATLSVVVSVLGAVAVTREISTTGDLLAIAKPVKKTSLESFFGGWRNLPFKLSDGDAEAIAQCLELTQRYNAIHNRVNRYSLPEVRESLEALLSKHPEFFYVEHLLGTWHQMNGNTAVAEDYFLRSYRHAPVVLIQRYEHADGSPIVGAAIRKFEIECNRVQGGSLDPSLNLKYFDLTTDSEGCVYLPVYDTVYRTSTRSFPEGFDVSYPKLGWFESRGKAAMLPTAGVGIVGGAYEQAVASDAAGVVRVSGRDFQLTKVRRMDAPEALELLEFPAWPHEFPHRGRFPELEEGDWDCLLVDIGGRQQFPKDFDVVQIRVFDHETRSVLWDSDSRYHKLEQDVEFTGGFVSALNNAVFLARRGGKWPENIDLWFRVDLLKDSPSAHHHLPVGKTDMAITTGGTGWVEIEEVRAGSWNVEYSEGGGEVTWLALNPESESHCTVVLRRSGDWEGGRLTVSAKDQRGNTYWPQSIHFVDFDRAELEVVNFPLPADQLLELEFGQVADPTDFRKTFYFDGIALDPLLAAPTEASGDNPSTANASGDTPIALNPRTESIPESPVSPETQNDSEPDADRPDGAFSVEFPGGYRAHVIGVGDTIGEASGIFWAADGSPMALAPEGVTADVSNVTLLPETIGRKFLVELLPPLNSHSMTGVTFMCKIERPGSSSTIGSSGSGASLRNAFDATFPMNAKDASVKVGVAAGPWKTVFSGCIGCDTGVSDSEFSATFSDVFDQDGAKRITVTHKSLEQERRVVAIDAASAAHPLRMTVSRDGEEMSQSEWIFDGIAPEEAEELEIQIRDYEWRTIHGIALYPHEKSAQSNGEQSSANSSDSPYSVFNHDYLGTLLEDPNLLTRIAGDAITPPAADTSWGPVVDGLQAAVRFIPEKETYALGETIGMEYLVRNIGPIPLEFLSSKWRNGDQCFVTDDQGKKRAGGTSQGTGLNPVRRVKLAPGEVGAIESASFTIMPEASGRSPLHPVATWARSHAGIHKVQFRVHFPDTYARSGDNAPRPDDWTGTLMTGERTIEFVDDPELFRAHSVFQIRMVAAKPDDKGAKAFPREASNRPPDEVDELWLLDDVLVGEGDLAAVGAVPGATPNEYAIEIRLNEKASERLALATEENIGHRMACMYQEMILAAPTLNGPVGDGKFVVGGKFSKDVAESMISEIRAANALDTKAPFMQPSTAPTLGPEVEVTIRHSGENCMIDFDTGKLFTPPNFNGTEDAFAWCAKNGIDAGGGNQDEVRGLIGIDIVLNPEANAIWDEAATNGALKHDAFKYGKPGNPVYLSAKGELPATWTFKTREGGLGIVQILGFDDEEPRGVKIRYRMLEKGSE
ncbi:MAG: hypothetical protein JNK74_11130 [Candidatus Hydrogenedentes bacterium]|nr:hypothetical protein [Candidatus Hydrogenedentota bacterium]